PEPRHPTALYEAFLEGLVMFVILWWVSAQPRRRGLVSGLFLLLYGVFRVWDGGMSFHGGLIGVLLAALWFARKKRMAFFSLTDFFAPMVPIGLGAGRIGNFINRELPGRVTEMPWGMPFPGMGPEPRHPTALYEAFLEGLVMFVILWWVSAQPRRRGLVSGLFLLLYGVFRFGVEFYRLPDAHIGYLAFGWFTMGMLLTLPMILFGILLIAWSRRQPLVGDKAIQ
ncbi:MAG: prolipoprotein diacylglyceryl transferase, partial [Billgrantia desiderata]